MPIAWPLAEWRAAISSQLDACGVVAARISIDPIEPSFGISPKRLVVAVAARLEPPELSGGATAVNLTEPGSGRARPFFDSADVVSYGKRFFSTVVGASGSFLKRKSAHAFAP